ncbi:MAG: hypothetical protein HOP30_17260 [Cyclobacteriaceae bacterium]|nr:hypothetical protein [Cyclobacteriaceae bacterium]
MRLTFISLLFTLAFLSCERRPNRFNPFDEVYKYDKTFNPSTIDTINAECGYYNLASGNDDLITYYQVYLDEPEIVAKGFELAIDTVEMDSVEFRKLNSVEQVKTLYCKIPIDTSLVLAKLSRIGVRNIKISSDSGVYCSIAMMNNDGDTVRADIDVFYYGEQRSMRRYIRFYKGK